MSGGTGRRGVKICGIRDELALDAASEAGADWVGFVFFDRSPRCVAPGRAAELQRRLERRALTVGLFVQPEPDEVGRVLDQVPLDVLQLYAGAAVASRIRERFGRPVWQAVGVATSAELPASSGLDGFVIESRQLPGSARPGGNGVAFDWSIMRAWQAPVPWLLAGGLTPDNVADAVAASGAPAVDVSSGVERILGEKDPALIRSFVAAARGA